MIETILVSAITSLAVVLWTLVILLAVSERAYNKVRRTSQAPTEESRDQQLP